VEAQQVLWRKILGWSKRLTWGRVLRWVGLLVAGAVVVVAGIYAVFWPLSDLIARHDVGAIIGPHRTAALQKNAAALQAARDAARGRLLAFGAGLFAAGALLYTARNFALSRQGQVTDRYTKAIEQLGSDKGFNVRIGGIYALERIARDSPRDHPTIMDVLAAFARQHARNPVVPSAEGEPRADPGERMTLPDVEAAVQVIGRRNPKYDRQAITEHLGGGVTYTYRHRLDLSRADLTGVGLSNANLADMRFDEATLAVADLFRADLTGSDLSGADLTRAKLPTAKLPRADLSRANLTGADLIGANLHGANLTGAKLTGADLNHADLEYADLNYADLTGANLQYAHLDYTGLYGTDFTRANFHGVRLNYADLSHANLTEARWPQYANIPRGWRRDIDSGCLERVDADLGNPPADPAPRV
jgi:hypothetical protein